MPRHLGIARVLALAALGLASLLGRLEAQFPPVAILDRDGNLGREYLAPAGVRGLAESLASAGDFDGDGSPDLVVGAPGGAEGAPGRAFLVPGARSGPAKRELSGGAYGTVEIRSGVSAPDRLGCAVAGAGDVDGDGFADLLVAAAAGAVAGLSRGGVFLVFGGLDLPPELELARELGGRARFFHSGEPNGAANGCSVAAAGDFDGDGLADFAIGMPGSGGGGGGPRGPHGAVWIVRGGTHLRAAPGIAQLGSLPASACVYVPGIEEGSEFGAAVAGVGDLDGDGLDDVAIGAPLEGIGGSAFVIFGTASPPETFDWAGAGEGSFAEFRGTAEGGRLGEALAAAPVGARGLGGVDATGDGAADLLLGAPGGRWEDLPGGAAYLVAGGPALRSSSVHALPSSAFATVVGLPFSGLGAAVALVPDADGDGMGDILAGAPGLRLGLGAAYLVRGGGPAGRRIEVERLGADEGTVFLAAGAGAELGAAVAGLPDRNGDLLGELAIGAPGLGGGDGRGAAFEVFRPQDPESPAPRDLTARVLPGGRVQLSWLVSRQHRSLRVYRDGRAISPELPGFLLSYVDLDPGPGRHVYFVEADGSEAGRSPSIEVEVRAIPVQDLACAQVEGTRRVRVAWRVADRYGGLRLRVDGEPFGDPLPPDATEAVIELPPGEHGIEVRDPAGGAGRSASCRVTVVDPVLPEIEGFSCSLAGARDVRLRWAPAEPYDSYLVYRDGLLVADIPAASEYLDEGVPPGEVLYELRGFQARTHRGPPARCRIEVEAPGPTSVRGTVSWEGGGRLRRGTVLVLDGSGREVARAQLSSQGEFRAEVPEPGLYAARFQVSLDLGGSPCALPQGFAAQAIAVEAPARTGDLAAIEVPPPVLLFATLGERGSQEAAASRWLPLRSRIGSGAFVFPLAVRGGIAEGALAIERWSEDLKACLEAELGEAPPSADAVAHGAAGLAARAWAAALARGSVRKLVLLGTPNLGTSRAKPEARAEAFTRPPRFVRPRGGGASPRGAEEPEFTGAVEETPEFAARWEAVLPARAAEEVHCVAGTAGLRALDSVLGCGEHDGRICSESALGGVEGSSAHKVAEDHETLGRGSRSVALVAGDILGLEALAGGGAGEPVEEAEGAEEPGAGGGLEPSYAISNTYVGVLEPGGLGELPLISDTSESMIVILNTGDPSGLRFEMRTPSGKTVGPADGGDPALDYYSFGDGEGRVVQAYAFSPCEPGVYVAVLGNPDGAEAVSYVLEAYLASEFTMAVRIDPADVRRGEETRVLASLARRGVPEVGAAVSVRVTRPDGDLVLLRALDDGAGADEAAADGVYSAAIPGSSQAGLHQVEVHASEEDPLLSRFQRDAVAWYRVWSDAAKFTGEFSWSVEDASGDGLWDGLWVEVGVESAESGAFFAAGTLADGSGTAVARASAAFSLEEGSRTTFGLYFSGAEIRAAKRDGPFVLADLWLYDGTAGFVPADHRSTALATSEMRWDEFGTPEGAPYLRGDANGDGSVDISDGITTLTALFAGGRLPECLAALDANDDGRVDVADPIFLFQYLFAGGESPPPPFPDCGEGARLPCPEHPACRR